MQGLRPSPQAMQAAHDTWVAVDPGVAPQRRMEKCVEAAFAQIPATGTASWPAVAMVAVLCAFLLGVLALFLR